MEKGEVGEFKTFTVKATSSHLTAFAILVEQDAEIPVRHVFERGEGRKKDTVSP